MRTLALFALVIVSAPGSARAELLRDCDCARLRTLPHADERKSPWVFETWSRVKGAADSLWRNETSFALVDGGPKDPSLACTCPATEREPAPTVYVSQRLVASLERDGQRDAAGKARQATLMAFVLGHELGHRLAEYDQHGHLTGGEGDWTEQERAADERGAFLALRAGAEPLPLEEDRVIERLIHRSPGAPTDERPFELRTGAVHERMQAMRAVEASFQQAWLLALGGETREAELALDTLRKEPLPGSHSVLPEFLLARAWATALELRTERLSCDPLLGPVALYSAYLAPKTRGTSKRTRADAIAELATLLKELDKTANRDSSSMLVLKACLAHAQRKPTEAVKWLELAAKRAHTPAVSALVERNKQAALAIAKGAKARGAVEDLGACEPVDAAEAAPFLVRPSDEKPVVEVALSEPWRRVEAWQAAGACGARQAASEGMEVVVLEYRGRTPYDSPWFSAVLQLDATGQVERAHLVRMNRGSGNELLSAAPRAELP